MTSDYIKTLRYWFDVEALMYPEVPKENIKRRRCVFKQAYTDPLPWQTPKYVEKSNEYKYFVYFGMIDKAVLEKELLELYAGIEDEENYSGNQKRDATGRTFLCAMEVTGTGVPVISTLQLAAYAIAFAERKNQKRYSYIHVSTSLETKMENLLSEADEAGVDGSFFGKVIESLISLLDWSPRELMATPQMVVHTIPLLNDKRKAVNPPTELDPINSFYLDDIADILNLAEDGTEFPQIKKYFEEERRNEQKVDVTQPDVLNALLRPNRFPPGRWPSGFPLFLMQQVAVNTALHEMKKGGIFSVNGPPGTGKTTLLMDVIAGRIVERAEVLASFDNPAQAFSPHLKFKYPENKDGRMLPGVSQVLDERLLDFGVVVASANNNAVENITRDLPNVKKISPDLLLWDDLPFDYFGGVAESIINAKANRRQKTKDAAAVVNDDAGELDEADAEGQAAVNQDKIKCWGLASVPLGKRKNCSLVASKLGYFGDKGGMLGVLAAESSNDLDWERARASFRIAVEEVITIQSAITDYENNVSQLRILTESLALAAVREKDAQKKLNLSLADRESLKHELSSSEAQSVSVLDERKLLNQEWPLWRQIFKWLFDQADYTRFRVRQNRLAEEADNLRSACAGLRRNVLKAEEQVRSLQRELDEMQYSVATARTEISKLEPTIAALAATLGSAVFDLETFSSLTTDDQQKSLPRSNAQYHKARSNVFVAAMHLHKSFMKNAGKPFETNFKLALAMLESEAYVQELLPVMAPHFWATFFLAVPVVSSTFASFARCFGNLRENQIGLLLIDEAGQAVPSQALGAIWRSKRALLVGDPLQVEPVIKMNKKLDAEILKYHDAPERHRLTKFSAQHLADRGNTHGSHVIQFNGNNLWVGSPLRVHRRCVDPMFTLSNRIAYNNKMVFGPDRNDEVEATAARPLFGFSRWINQETDGFDEHFNFAEGLIAAEIVIHYAKADWVHHTDGLPDIFVISPFKSVADNLTALLVDHAGEWVPPHVDEDAVRDWLKDHVGTVHTFQGKECESVIFVLGGKTAGAINWAANSPNIINVATTRAKRRFYVIGNRKKWRLSTFGEKLTEAFVTEPLDDQFIAAILQKPPH